MSREASCRRSSRSTAGGLANPLGIDLDPSNEGPQHPEHLELTILVDLDVQVRLPGRVRALLVDHDDRPAGSSLGDEPPLRLDRVSLPVPGMADDRIGAPEDHDVGPVLDLAQRGRDPSRALERQDARRRRASVARLDHRSDPVGKFQGGSHGLAGRRSQAQDDRCLCSCPAARPPAARLPRPRRALP